MKTFLLSILSVALAAGPAIGAEEPDQPKPPKNRPAAVAPRHVNPAPRTVPQTPRVQQNVNVTPRFQPRVNPTRTNPNRIYTPNPNRVYTPDLQTRTHVRNNPTVTTLDQDAPRPNTPFRSDTNLPNSEWRNRVRNRNNTPVVTPQPPQSSTTTAQSNTQSTTNTRNRDWQNRTNTNRNWQNNNTSGAFTFEDARRRRDHNHHHRSWWRSHFNRFALFGGGYYYWDNNYWYPAYGYDPYYSSYSYDEPIYGYQDQEPGQVIASVQTELQRLGYYRDAVDGVMGPATRAALANFQRDNGLSITAAIDGPTLRSLRLG